MTIEIKKVKAFMADICECNATPYEGYTRVCFGPQELQARDLIIARMEQVGLDTSAEKLKTLYRFISVELALYKSI